MDKPSNESNANRTSGELQARAPRRVIVRKKAKQLNARTEFKADCVTHCK